MAPFPAEIRMPARLESLYPLMEVVRSSARQTGAGDERIGEIDLVLEELLVNIFSYAYPDEPGDVAIVCRPDDAGRLLVEITDRGIPFDILTRKDPDVKADVNERNIGGLGLFLVKQLVQDIRYRREGGKNIVTLIIEPHATRL